MKKVKRGLAVLLVLCTQWATAQGLADVMRYSRQDPLGSARSMGMGGAMTGLGADLGAIWRRKCLKGAIWMLDVIFQIPKPFEHTFWNAFLPNFDTMKPHYNKQTGCKPQPHKIMDGYSTTLAWRIACERMNPHRALWHNSASKTNTEQ